MPAERRELSTSRRSRLNFTHLHDQLLCDAQQTQEPPALSRLSNIDCYIFGCARRKSKKSWSQAVQVASQHHNCEAKLACLCWRDATVRSCVQAPRWLRKHCLLLCTLALIACFELIEGTSMDQKMTRYSLGMTSYTLKPSASKAY